MKIKLDPGEIAAILKDWAKTKYKTHNINCDFVISKATVEAELEIIMQEDGYSGPSAEIPKEELYKWAKIIHDKSELPQPDFTPDFGISEGI